MSGAGRRDTEPIVCHAGHRPTHSPKTPPRPQGEWQDRECERGRFGLVHKASGVQPQQPPAVHTYSTYLYAGA